MNDVKELLEAIPDQIKNLEKSIKESNLNRVQVKNILENLRSSLDYIAKILSSITNGPEKNYFPYGQRSNHFKKSIQRNLPKLQNSLPEIYDLIEGVQPFKSNSNWLIDLCSLTNEAKHNGLNKISSDKNTELVMGNGIRMRNSKNVTFKNMSYNNKKLNKLKFDSDKIQEFNGDKDFPLRIIDDTIIEFMGKSIEIVPFLNNCLNEISSLNSDISEKIN